MSSTGAVTKLGRGLPRGGWLVGPLVGIVWMVYPIGAVVSSGPSPARLVFTVVGAALFGGILLWLLWLHEPLSPVTAVPAQLRKRRAALAELVALAAALTLFSAGEWVALFFHINIVAGIVLLRRDAYVAIMLLAPLAVALGTISDLSGLAFPMAAVGLWATAFVSQIATVAELRAAREELAQLAVAEERLRFARDLHDLLGHSLSLISLKTELAGKLLRAAPERAATEIDDAQEVARRALREVREAVSGYRQPTLGEELAGAREMLEAAGIACRIENNAGLLPKPVEAMLAWTVREATTNVIRHSRARHCAIRLNRRHREAETVDAEVSDDVRGLIHARSGNGATDVAASSMDGATGGSGLTGLAERVAGFDGAAFEAGPLPTGGFRLRVSLPLQVGAVEHRKDGQR
jgi:two-component system, NarL family, sensor histidine kinase DesK